MECCILCEHPLSERTSHFCHNCESLYKNCRDCGSFVKASRQMADGSFSCLQCVRCAQCGAKAPLLGEYRWETGQDLYCGSCVKNKS